MAKQSGKENSSPIDVCVLSIGKEDSWKGTPLDAEEERSKAEYTNNTMADGHSNSPPIQINESKTTEKTNSVIEIAVHDMNKGKKSGKSPFPRVCAPTQRELEAFKKSPPVVRAATAAPPVGSGKATSPKASNEMMIYSPTKEVESSGKKEVTPPMAVVSPPRVQIQLSASAPAAVIDGSGGGGSGARKELEDAIQRIETHIKNEQAARRTAESALAQARQQSQSQDTFPATQLLSVAPTSSFAELQVALEDLANAQLAVQRAHAVVAYILSQQQKQQQSLSSGKTPGGTSASTTTAASDVPATLSLAKAITKERGMSWVAGGPKEQNTTLPSLKLNMVRKKESNTLPSSPKTRGAPFSSRRNESGLSSPTRSGDSSISGHSSGMNSPKSAEWKNDRFATGKAEAFMITQASRWNSAAKGK